MTPGIGWCKTRIVMLRSCPLCVYPLSQVLDVTTSILAYTHVLQAIKGWRCEWPASLIVMLSGFPLPSCHLNCWQEPRHSASGRINENNRECYNIRQFLSSSPIRQSSTPSHNTARERHVFKPQLQERITYLKSGYKEALCVQLTSTVTVRMNILWQGCMCTLHVGCVRSSYATVTIQCHWFHKLCQLQHSTYICIHVHLCT